MQSFSTEFTLKQCQENGCFTGYASVFDVQDHHQEKITKGAFQKTLQQWQRKGKWPKMLWQHDPHKIIGTWQHIIEDENGLLVKGRLLLNIPQAQEAYTLMKAEALEGLSIGFISKQSRRDPKQACRLIEEVDLHEISLVTFAANPMACISSYKQNSESRDRSLIQRLDTLASRIRADL